MKGGKHVGLMLVGRIINGKAYSNYKEMLLAITRASNEWYDKNPDELEEIGDYTIKQVTDKDVWNSDYKRYYYKSNERLYRNYPDRPFLVTSEHHYFVSFHDREDHWYDQLSSSKQFVEALEQLDHMRYIEIDQLFLEYQRVHYVKKLLQASYKLDEKDTALFAFIAQLLNVQEAVLPLLSFVDVKSDNLEELTRKVAMLGISDSSQLIQAFNLISKDKDVYFTERHLYYFERMITYKPERCKTINNLLDLYCTKLIVQALNMLAINDPAGIAQAIQILQVNAPYIPLIGKISDDCQLSEVGNLLKIENIEKLQHVIKEICEKVDPEYIFSPPNYPNFTASHSKMNAFQMLLYVAMHLYIDNFEELLSNNPPDLYINNFEELLLRYRPDLLMRIAHMLGIEDVGLQIKVARAIGISGKELFSYSLRQFEDVNNTTFSLYRQLLTKYGKSLELVATDVEAVINHVLYELLVSFHTERLSNGAIRCALEWKNRNTLGRLKKRLKHRASGIRRRRIALIRLQLKARAKVPSSATRPRHIVYKARSNISSPHIEYKKALQATRTSTGEEHSSTVLVMLPGYSTIAAVLTGTDDELVALTRRTGT